MPCDWIGIVTIRSDTRTSRSITGMIRARPGSFTPATLPSRNNTPLVSRHDLYRQRQPDQGDDGENHKKDDQSIHDRSSISTRLSVLECRESNGPWQFACLCGRT
jgi:hypothetical protein